ncbi:hypothetical protein LOCC1_G006081 [Lachnellula occidentalis]|uniref:Uncharacterized protein n=1 Tax=Lachnellula occidentalis TaxID=215460 RepID=A0A8H8RUC3_9HELO|nr:hypothetical protein LOCC1_G006081 [Lachnellula occidentalis]
MSFLYEDGGMYIILATIDAAAHRYHWGLFICVSDGFGMVYHVTNSTGGWSLEEHMIEHAVFSRDIVAALLIGTGLQDDAADAAHRIVTSAPVIADGSHDSKWGENFTCRIWILEAVDRLRGNGLIPDEEAREVQDDAFRLAMSATSTGTRKMGRSTVIENQGY